MTDTKDTAPEIRGGFPQIRPVDDAPPELGRFVAAIRRLQDLTVSTNPEPSTWAIAAQHVENACALLDGCQVPDAPEIPVRAGRVISLPGLGHPLMPPWTATESGPDGVVMEGHFTRSHVGGNHAVHGGMIPLFYDWLFSDGGLYGGHSRHSHGYLHVDYRKITPIHEPLTAHGRITEIDGRTHFIAATMTDANGALLSEANGLMVRLLPHQP